MCRSVYLAQPVSSSSSRLQAARLADAAKAAVKAAAESPPPWMRKQMALHNLIVIA